LNLWLSLWHPCDICGGSEQEHRLKVLFQVLDVNGDGGICVNDLTIGPDLRSLVPPSVSLCDAEEVNGRSLHAWFQL
uniref:EF-hand domain-containing protein n=1 Tax=Neolamprologus brichardi TaxID=32507 RepID=A0A3Q4GDZ0_NEOBR